MSRRSALPALTMAAGLWPPSTITRGRWPVPPLVGGGSVEGDLSNGVAEIFLMVGVDVGDDRNPEVERVGRVEPSSQTHLAHQELNPRSEINDGQGGEHLELGGGAHFRR